MPTDIDRLHKVFEKKRAGLTELLPRGCGKTFVDCHLAAGLVEVEQKHIICVVPRQSFFYRTMREVFEEHKLHLEFDSCRHALRSGDALTEFVRADPIAMRGRPRDAEYLDFDDRFIPDTIDVWEMRPAPIFMDEETWNRVCTWPETMEFDEA